MRLSVVALALLGLAVCAYAIDKESGDTRASFPRPGTDRPTCILPIVGLRCTVDSRTGFVAGMRYSYGPIGEFNVCSQGNGFQTTWNMSPTSPLYQQSIPVTRPAAVNVPNWPDGTPIPQSQLMQYNSFISQVIVLKAENPLGPTFGDIPAIIFRYTNAELVAARAAGNVPSEFRWAVCGNQAYADAYLTPGAQPPPPTPVELKAVYVSPLSDTSVNPTFLGSFQAKCAVRGSNYLGGDPQTSSKFFIKQLKQVCFTEVASVIAAVPKTPAPTPPPVDVNWDAPFTPCFWDKKDSKKSASFSCAQSGAAVATGKYAAIYLDTATGQPMDWQMKEDGDFEVVPFKDIYMGSDPAGEEDEADDSE